MQYLAESENFKVTSEYEAVYLEFKGQARSRLIIGDFYGDPDCAVISKDETFVAMGGCGLIIYFLREPFDEYQYVPSAVNQYFELFWEKDNKRWVNGLHQERMDQDWKYIRYVDFNFENDLRVFRLDVINRDVALATT